MSVINTNFKSLITQNNLTVNNRNLSDAMEKLSTGKRINSAADDAWPGHQQQDDGPDPRPEPVGAQRQRRHLDAADR